jgi:hypothetical protein
MMVLSRKRIDDWLWRSFVSAVGSRQTERDHAMSRRYSSGPPVGPFIGLVLAAFLITIVLPYVLTHAH